MSRSSGCIAGAVVVALGAATGLSGCGSSGPDAAVIDQQIRQKYGALVSLNEKASEAVDPAVCGARYQSAGFSGGLDVNSQISGLFNKDPNVQALKNANYPWYASITENFNARLTACRLASGNGPAARDSWSAVIQQAKYNAEWGSSGAGFATGLVGSLVLIAKVARTRELKEAIGHLAVEVASAQLTSVMHDSSSIIRTGVPSYMGTLADALRVAGRDAEADQMATRAASPETVAAAAQAQREWDDNLARDQARIDAEDAENDAAIWSAMTQGLGNIAGAAAAPGGSYNPYSWHDAPPTPPCVTPGHLTPGGGCSYEPVEGGSRTGGSGDSYKIVDPSSTCYKGEVWMPARICVYGAR